MREYCLITKSGHVVNMSQSYKPEPPTLTEYQIEKGYKWVPRSEVSMAALTSYRFWSERP